MEISGFVRSCVAAASLLAVTALSADAAPADPYDGRWHFSFAPVVWLPAFSGTFQYQAPSGTTGQFSVHASAGDLLSALKFAVMGDGDIRKGDWSGFTDLLYVSLGNNKSKVSSITGPGGVVTIPINVDTRSSLKNFVGTFAGAYSLYHEGGSSLDGFVGARYFDARPSVDWTLTGPVGAFPVSGHATAKSTFWDAIAGIKGRYAFDGSSWFLKGYADIGTGEADLTWQGFAGGGYAFSWGDVELGFRYLAYHPGSKMKTIKDLALYGPALGVRFYF